MILLLKTDDRHVEGVRKHAKHASDGIPHRISKGDLLLIQVTYLSRRTPVATIRYSMEFVRCYEDLDNESDAIWKRHWRYIIEGKDLKMLRRPFDIRRYQQSSKDYSSAERYAYVEPEDEAELRRREILEVV